MSKKALMINMEFWLQGGLFPAAATSSSSVTPATESGITIISFSLGIRIP